MLNIFTIILIHLASVLGISGDPLTNIDIEGVLKLAKYASWPPEATQIRIVMVPQSAESFSSAQAYLKNQYLDDKQVILEKYTPECSLTGATIIFIEKQAGVDVEKITSQIAGLGILTITNDIINLDNGCMFYIECKDDMLDYKYNKQAVINSGLMIKGSVLAPYHCYNQQ